MENQNILDEIAKKLNVSSYEMALAFLTGIVAVRGEICISNGEFGLSIDLKNEEIANTIFNIVNPYYISTKNNFTLNFDYVITQQILSDSGLVQYDENNNMIFVSNLSKLVLSEENIKYYIIGVVISGGCFRVFSRKERSEGYHFEVSFVSDCYSVDFMQALAELNIESKKIIKKGLNLVYLKNAEQISDLMALCGASESAIELNEQIALKQVKSNVNRVNNCDSANINKTINASFNQLKAIEQINNIAGLDILDEKLYELALLRLANPEDSLESLAELSKYSKTKNAVYYGIKKIEKIANLL